MKRKSSLLLLVSCMSCVQLSALEHTLEAPGAFVENNVLYCSQGLHIHISDEHFSYGKSHILADSMRWDRSNQKVFLNGKVSVLHKNYSLRAERLGFHLSEQTGEAWNVELEYRENGQRIRLRCDYLALHPDYFLCKGLYIDRGNGAVINLSASTIKIKRAHKEHAHRDGFTKSIDSLLIRHPRFKAGPIPFFYLPVLYRDYRLDYPWTQFEIGQSSKRGAYIVSRIGTDLPRIGEFSSRIQYRNDNYELSGRGDGIETFWKDPLLGEGSFTWFQMDPEIYYTDTSGGFFENGDFYDEMTGTRTARRSAIYRDIEHRLSFSGGAAYMRWSDIPQSITDNSDEDTFRADFAADDMRNKPLARQGISAAWSSNALDFVYSRDQQAMERSNRVGRLHGIEINLRPLRLHDRLYAQATFNAEQFSKNDFTQILAPQSETWRIRGEASLGGSKWFNAYGLDYSAGVRTLQYTNAIVDDNEISDSSTVVPFMNFGIKTRLQAQFNNGYAHSFTPRLALELLSSASGTTTTPFDIGDFRDTIEENKILLHTGYDNNIYKGSRSLRMTNVARWLVRDQDKNYIDNNGNPQTSSNPLFDIKNTISGSVQDISLNAQFDYSGLRSDWTRFDLGLRWVIKKNISFTHTSNLVPASANNLIERHWQHRPGFAISGERYGLDTSLTFREGGKTVDGLLLQLTRNMVEGEIGIAYAVENDINGNETESSIRFFFSLGVF